MYGFIMSRFIPSIPTCWDLCYYKRMLNFVKWFSASIKMIVWFVFWCTTVIWYLCTLQNDHHNKSSYHLSPHRHIALSLTVPYYSPTTRLFCISNLPHLFHSSPLWQPPVCSMYLWVCFCFVMFVCFVSQISQVSEVIWYLSFSVWLISLSIIPARFIHVVTNGKISFFYGWVIFHFIYMYISQYHIFSFFFKRSQFDSP